jgi:3-dehydroquinate synthase
MTTVHIQLPAPAAPAYDVVVAPDLLDSLGQHVRAVAPAPSCALVSDTNVAPLYLATAKDSLAAAGYRVIEHVIPAGEDHKHIHTAVAVIDTILNARIERATPVIALGGGVVGDLAGFVAASVLRGVPFVQVPTTLLAAVDASVGGKVGIDHPTGKNLIGAFHQPRLVLTDISAFRTLPIRELRCGLAECIKHAIIRDASLFQFIADHLPRILACDTTALQELVTRNVRIKAAIVQEDPFEHGVRALLNLGHTFGHAIENVTDYRVQHGECVALGTIAAARLSHARGTLSARAVDRIITLITAAGLPASLPDLDLEPTLAIMTTDKKVRGGKIRFVIPTSIGAAQIIDDTTPDQIRAALASLRSPSDTL